MKKTLLWIAVLPAAIIGYVIANLLIDFSYSFYGNYDFGWNWLRIINKFFLVSAKSMGSAIIFIFIGMKVAPAHKREVFIFLLSAAIITPTCLLLATLYLHYNYTKEECVGMFFHYIGCLLALAYLPEKKEVIINAEIEKIDSADSISNLSIPLLEITDEMFEALKTMYPNSNMTRQQAIDKVNSVRAFKYLRQK